MAFVWLIIGLVLGGLVSLVTLCCLQIGRVNEQQSEVRRLKSELARIGERNVR